MLRAPEAAAIGLIDHVVAPAELDAAVREALGCGVVTERVPGAIPPSLRAVAEVFAQTKAESLLAGEPRSHPDPIVQQALKRLAGKAPIAVRIASELIEHGARLPLADALPLELDQLMQIFRTHDALIGLKSIGGSPPRFEGR
jgi:enoyl-CoA hydratase/carnithine racemase